MKTQTISEDNNFKELCGDNLDEETVYTAFTGVVGLSRREVALLLLGRFGTTLQNAERKTTCHVRYLH